MDEDLDKDGDGDEDKDEDKAEETNERHPGKDNRPGTFGRTPARCGR